MWRKSIVVFLSGLLHLLSLAQSAVDVDSILNLTGCESPEDMDVHEVERLYSYLERPLKINLASVSSLRSCGLFSPYQAASLADYRARHGDMMSYAELSAVDGFTAETVRLLAPFISLEGGTIGIRDGDRKDLVSDLAIKGGVSVSNFDISGGYAVKYRCTRGESLSFSISASRANGPVFGIPDIFSGNLTWTSGRRPFKMIVGDFNARFGQGLALWNGMSMTGVSSPASVFRSASGLSSSWSFTGSTAHTGLAAEYSFLHMRISSFVAFPLIKSDEAGILPGFNLGWYWKNMCLSVTHYAEFIPKSGMTALYIPDMKTSIDIASCVKGTDIFSELAFDWVNRVPAMLAGIRFPAGESLTMASHLRFYPVSFDPVRSAAPRSVSKCSNEYGASLCLSYAPKTGMFTGTMSLDAAYLPDTKGDDESIHLKVFSEGGIRISDAVLLKLRVAERFRTWGRRFKTDVRADIEWTAGLFSVGGRLNLVQCADVGFLSYIEGGYKSDRFSVYLRQLFFIADDWDDRIYAYERDAPGSFSVPAFYGRGMHTALTVSLKISRWVKIYVKGTVTSYTFEPAEKQKPGKAGLKLQLVFSF